MEDLIIEFKQWQCILKKGYYSNGRIAIQLIDAKDHSLVAVATVNLPDVELNPGEIIIKNYSENEGMLNVLYDAKIIGPVLRMVKTGFVECPIVQLLIK